MSNVTSESKLTTKEIVEQAIQDYHESILPYLNGQVPTIANKFDKANLYSTDEQIVGRWIDGKPLYLKTIDLGSAITVRSTEWTDTSEPHHGVVETVIKCWGTNGQAATPLLALADSARTVWAIEASRNEDSITVRYVAFQYTKTTDEAIAIGSDTDYSLEEKIVGTWIDGKPIYQKTVNFGTLPNATDKLVAHGISNLSYVIKVEGTATSGSVFRPLPLIYNSVYATYNTSMDVSGTNITMSTTQDRSAWTAYITLYYTKTTD